MANCETTPIANCGSIPVDRTSVVVCGAPYVVHRIRSDRGASTRKVVCGSSYVVRPSSSAIEVRPHVSTHTQVRMWFVASRDRGSSTRIYPHASSYVGSSRAAREVRPHVSTHTQVRMWFAVCGSSLKERPHESRSDRGSSTRIDPHERFADARPFVVREPSAIHT